MQPFYFLAVVGSRLISVLSMLMLAHIMTANAFGQFALINTNALAIQMVAGSWLVSLANRAMTSSGDTIDHTMLAAIMTALLIVASTVLMAGMAFGATHPEQGLIPLTTAVLALVFILYEMVLALKNAMAKEAAYARYAIYRNVLSLALGVGLVLAGIGTMGPVLGLLIASTLPLVLLPDTRRIWNNAHPSWAALGHMRPYLRHGLAGGVALGAYILVNAPNRNLFAHQFGVEVSGIWTLCADLSYGPLAVVGNAYSLSQVRLIYLSASIGDTASLRYRARALVESTLVLVLPYSIGAYLFANNVVKLLLPKEQADIAATIVVSAALQGAALLLLYNLTSIMLARRRYWLVVVMVLTVAAAATAGASTSSGIVQGAHAAMAGSVGAVGFWLAWGLANKFFHVNLRELAKLAFASAIFWATARCAELVLLYLGAENASWYVALGISIISYVYAAIWLKISGFTNMIPQAIRRRFPHLVHNIDES